MQVNISMWISRNAQIFRSRVAVKDERWSWTYPEFNERIGRLATALKQQGIRKGDRVATLLQNSVEMVELLFACARVGAIYVPLNWRLGEDELAFILDDCSPRLLFHEEKWKERAQNLRGRMENGLALIAVTEDIEASPYEALLREATPDWGHELNAFDDDDLMLIYTSGTTGLPKGVILTHTNIFAQCVNALTLGADPTDVTLVVLPLFHVGGLNGAATPILHIGGTVIFQRSFSTAGTLKLIEEEKVTGFLAVPTIFRLLADTPEFQTTDLSHCKVLLSGGAPLPESLIELYHHRGLEFRQGYGLTEAAPGVTGMGPGECRNKAGSAGRCILYTEVRIVDAHGNDVPEGESGEIITRGPNIMKGYWNRPDATADTLKNGWLHTGDVGKFDEDGFLYIVDRKKDMIISGGENIYPAEIEKLLAGHPMVAQATVVARPHDKWGEVPVAVIVPREGEVETEEFKEFLKPRLARYKIPKEYHLVESLPMNASGKVVKAEVRKSLGFTR